VVVYEYTCTGYKSFRGTINVTKEESHKYMSYPDGYGSITITNVPGDDDFVTIYDEYDAKLNNI
jgi:hypothetical protein